MNTFSPRRFLLHLVPMIVATILLSIGGVQTVAADTTDSVPVVVSITNPDQGTSTPTDPTVTPVATATATPGGGSNGGGGNSGGGSNTVKSLPSTGAAADAGSDLVPAFLVLAGGGMLAGSVYVGRRRSA